MRNEAKASADILGYQFIYGRKDFLNLISDAEIGTTYIFMDPIRIEPQKTITGVIESEKATGKFMMLEKSEMDEMYDETLNGVGVLENSKYQSYIEPMKVKLESYISNIENCLSGWSFEYNYVEVISVFDEGMDGLLINYTAKKYR